LLGGRVLYSQPATGFRSGIEPVLLAASVQARPGERVLEAGTGAGAALLCLGTRVPGVIGRGVEIDESFARLAAANARANGLTDIEVVAVRIEDAVFPYQFDHAMANPPYHPQGGSASPVAERETAKRGSGSLMLTWIEALARTLRHRGSLTLIVPGGMVSDCLTAMSGCRCPCTVLFPLWPKAGRAAKLVILRGLKNARSPMQLMPGLVLHQPDGSFTAAAQAILRDGAALSLDSA
jgi:tRNA1(Val) A37 N6-methylase TrmN6